MSYTEPKITAQLLTHLRAQLLGSGARVYKHADNFTPGIPDFEVILNGYSSWFECKLLRHGLHELTRELREVQLVELCKLEVATKGRAWILIWTLSGRGRASEKSLYLMRPSAEKARRQTRGEEQPFETGDFALALPGGGFGHEAMLPFILHLHRSDYVPSA